MQTLARVVPLCRFRIAAAAYLTLMLLAGCNSKTSVSQEERSDTAGVTLRLLVIGDPALAQEIRLLRGEWQAQTEGDLDLVELAEDELPADGKLNADAVIYPAYRLGDLASRNALLPLSKRNLGREELAEPAIFDLIRSSEMTWGESVYAVPLGSPIYMLYYRSDLLGEKTPPDTWTELSRLTSSWEKPAANSTSGGDEAAEEWSPTLEPLAPGWAGRTLLARAAPYVKHRDYYSALFEPETMRPLIDSEPMVRALDEIVAAAKRAGHDQTMLTPDDVRREFLAGRAGMALTWPGPADKGDDSRQPSAAGRAVAYGIAELPGANEVFNFESGRWQKRFPDESGRVPLLSISGRLGSVTAETAHPDAAFMLLARLSGDPWGDQLSPASTATAPYRKTQVGKAAAWMGTAATGDTAIQYGEAIAASLSQPNSLSMLRIPGHERYMAALDNAVIQTVHGEKSAQEALTGAADAWQAITNELGLEAQKVAYLRSLGREQ